MPGWRYIAHPAVSQIHTGFRRRVKRRECLLSTHWNSICRGLVNATSKTKVPHISLGGDCAMPARSAVVCYQSFAYRRVRISVRSEMAIPYRVYTRINIYFLYMFYGPASVRGQKRIGNIETLTVRVRLRRV